MHEVHPVLGPEEDFTNSIGSYVILRPCHVMSRESHPDHTL